MKLNWLGYLFYSLGNCVMKLYIETDLSSSFVYSVRPCLDVKCFWISLM